MGPGLFWVFSPARKTAQFCALLLGAGSRVARYSPSNGCSLLHTFHIHSQNTLSPSCVRGILVGIEVSDIPIHMFQPKGRRQTIIELWNRSTDLVVKGQKVFWSRWLELSF